MKEQFEITLAWLKETCEQALTEAQTGNTALLNRLGKNGSFAYYLNNVHTRKVMSPEQFAGQFEAQMKDLNEVRLQYELVSEQPARDARMASLEEGFNELKAMVQQLLESQKPAEAPKAKGKKAAEPVTEETTDEASAESEA